MDLQRMRWIANILASKQIPTDQRADHVNGRGSPKDRKARRHWLVNTYGNGETVPCLYCGCELTSDTLTVERLLPGKNGGRYHHPNIMPACDHCNKSRKDAPFVPFATENVGKKADWDLAA
jgi:5-methylcytosine-specific restriction endonuclease McrA